MFQYENILQQMSNELNSIKQEIDMSKDNKKNNDLLKTYKIIQSIIAKLLELKMNSK